MGDSGDDEFDRHSRSRDKFKREREERDDHDRPRRDDHVDHRRRDYDRRSGGREYNDRYNRDRSPAYKRSKRDGSPGGPPGGMHPFYPPAYPPYGMPPAAAPWPMPDMGAHQNNHSNDKHSNEDSFMKRFKQFVMSLKDDVDEHEAVETYRKYKTKYKKNSITKFYKAHQNEEWFREKFHPDYLVRKKKDLKQCKIKRLEIYKRIQELGYLDDLGVCHEDQDKLMKALDAAVILMEGGSVHDLTILDGRDRNSDKPLVAIPVAKLKKEKPPANKEDDDSDSEDGNIKDEPESPGSDEPEKKLPQPLHKPQSLFVRSLTPLITREDLLHVVKSLNLPGFLRLAMAEPLPDRKYYRRAWVTFAHNTDIKEACSVLMSSKVEKYDHELNVVINRELSKRVRFVPSFTRSLYAVQQDVKWLEILITELDKAAGLWVTKLKQEDEEEGEDDSEDKPTQRPGELYENPMIDELRLFTEDSLKTPTLDHELDQGETDEDEIHIINDKKLKVLDRLIVYLRVVHMVDYYNGTEFPNEDEMPNKIGVFHIRGPVETSNSKNSLQDVHDWNKQLGGKMQSVIDDMRGVTIPQDEAVEIGLKTEEETVEEFVKQNTEEQGPGKFHCPLSGKKFKGPEFVRKHIFNKHAEKVENVKKDAVFWNNYVREPKRPMEPLFPPTQQSNNGQSYANSAPNPSYAAPPRPSYPGFPPPYGFPAPFPQAPAPKGRKVISYNDLDAPDEYDVLGV